MRSNSLSRKSRVPAKDLWISIPVLGPSTYNKNILLKWKKKISFPFWLFFFLSHFLDPVHAPGLCGRSSLARRITLNLLQLHRALTLHSAPNRGSGPYTARYLSSLWFILSLLNALSSAGTLSSTCFHLFQSTQHTCDIWYSEILKNLTNSG